MHAWVQFANKAFARAGITFGYRGSRGHGLPEKYAPEPNGSGGLEWEVSPGMRPSRAGRARYPGKLLVFIRWGPGQNPTGNANGGGDWDFMIMGAFEAMRHCGHPHIDAFAPTLGHHFGLPHTFVGNSFATREAAEEYLLARGNKPEVFDGDGFRSDWPTRRSASCVQFTNAVPQRPKFLARRSLMSTRRARQLTPQPLHRVRGRSERFETSWPCRKTDAQARIEAETLKISDVRKASTVVQEMTGFGMVGMVHGWSRDTQLFIGAETGGTISLTFDVPAARHCMFNIYLTQTPDFGIGQFKLDGTATGGPVDCYAPLVIPSGRVGWARFS